MAPERLLVFEVRGSIQSLANAVRNIDGLELVDEDELASDGSDAAPAVYLMVPDVRALNELLSRWRRWQRRETPTGDAPWRDLFNTLRDIRTWGPQDRVRHDDAAALAEEAAEAGPNGRIRAELELVFRAQTEHAEAAEATVTRFLAERDGRVVSRARIPDIGYHALLVDLPTIQVQKIVERSPEGVAGVDPVMAIRPQSLATRIEIGDRSEPDGQSVAAELETPILALIDGVPVAAHPLLADHIDLDDPFDLEASAPVSERVHGTAMASLIVHGDRNKNEASLPRRIHVVPVMGGRDEFPADRLVVDLVYTAIRRMRGAGGTAPGVLIVNISLGNRRRQFYNQMSPWARLLDRLAYEYGILFLVSAGNNITEFGIADYQTRMSFEDAEVASRSASVLRSLGQIVADRKIISPAETVNGLTVGACNDDSVPEAWRVAARANIDPYGNVRTANPSSSLGPGFARSVKPDLLMPGARERLIVVGNDPHVRVRPANPARAFGLKVAAPPRQGLENLDGYTNGTSAANALASRTCHRIHDALENAYGDAFSSLSHIERAVLLKALLVHPARWPSDTAQFITDTITPAGSHHTVKKDNIRRFLGFGIVEANDAVACAADRATFWAVGFLDPRKTATLRIPVPVAMHSQALPHTMAATLAWFAPVSPGRKSYRAVRLKILDPATLPSLGVAASSNAPDSNQTNRGTVFHRCWTGRKAPVVTADMNVELTVQREPDQGMAVDARVPYGIAITLEMPGVAEIYDQVRQRLAVPIAPIQA